jgi:thiol-disulfide isomerase/thioredoxin
MAKLATELLPTAKQHPVGGPTGRAKAAIDTVTGSTPPPIELPTLGSAVPVTTTAYRGRYVALNFWSPGCSLCRTELPALEHAHKDLGSAADIVGIDSSDPNGVGVAIASRAGVSYPQLIDRQGSTAAQYEIPGFPYTVILDPKGKVVVRHPGAMTTEQLVYLLQTLTSEAPEG